MTVAVASSKAFWVLFLGGISLIQLIKRPSRQVVGVSRRGEGRRQAGSGPNKVND